MAWIGRGFRDHLLLPKKEHPPLDQVAPSSLGILWNHPLILWFFENGWSCSLEYQLLLNPGQTFPPFFFFFCTGSLFLFLNPFFLFFWETIKFMWRRKENLFLAARARSASFFKIPARAICQKTLWEAQSLSLVEPSWAWTLPWFELLSAAGNLFISDFTG